MEFFFFRIDSRKQMLTRPGGENWSGEATRSQGFAVEETRVDVTIGDENAADNANAAVRKERPIWMMESTVVSNEKTSVCYFFFLFLSNRQLNLLCCIAGCLILKYFKNI